MSRAFTVNGRQKEPTTQAYGVVQLPFSWQMSRTGGGGGGEEQPFHTQLTIIEAIVSGFVKCAWTDSLISVVFPAKKMVLDPVRNANENVTRKN